MMCAGWNALLSESGGDGRISWIDQRISSGVVMLWFAGRRLFFLAVAD